MLPNRLAIRKGIRSHFGSRAGASARRLCHESRFGRMRNRGPGKWREWRWGSTVVPLYPLEGPPPTDPSNPSASKPLSEIAHLTITKLTAKNCQAKLTDGIAEMVKTPDSPGGRFNESKLRKLFEETAHANLSPEEVEEIFPSPVPAGDPPSRTGSRRPSKSGSRKASKDKLTEG
mmetsp:Transcript_67504/g.158971  ORF Transcript_67504/g.158971 Transcript_67504/m.158971 type:complete len:175 (-) Transcript_67504:113-637(-)